MGPVNATPAPHDNGSHTATIRCPTATHPAPVRIGSVGVLVGEDRRSSFSQPCRFQILIE